VEIAQLGVMIKKVMEEPVDNKVETDAKATASPKN
jgi:hypothetical protein